MVPRVNYSLLLVVVLRLLCTQSAAEKAQVPDWLDTLAPAVVLDPAPGMYRTPQIVTITTDEPADIFVAVSSDSLFNPVTEPVILDKNSTYTLWLYAIDYSQNSTDTIKAVYTIDPLPPRIRIRPEEGVFRDSVEVEFSANEPVSFFFKPHETDSEMVLPSARQTLFSSFKGLVFARDSAGNQSRPYPVDIRVEAYSDTIQLDPPPGKYSRETAIAMRSEKGADIFWSFNASAHAEAFEPYRGPVQLKQGQHLLRYYSQSKNGWKTPVQQALYQLDTVAPVLRFTFLKGSVADTLRISTSEKSRIYISADPTHHKSSFRPYAGAIAIAPRGLFRIWAYAVDSSNNTSGYKKFEKKYDFNAPQPVLHIRGFLHEKPIELKISVNEPATVFYTLDGSTPHEKSPVYMSGIVISKQGVTRIGFFAVDEAQNKSAVFYDSIKIDSEPPHIREEVRWNEIRREFTIRLSANEPAEIYYVLGMGDQRGQKPLRYQQPVVLLPGQVLRYFAVDLVGNRSQEKVIDEIKKPQPTPSVKGGMYNYKLRIDFSTNITSDIYWRVLPDTAFSLYDTAVVLSTEGLYALEYYAQTPSGLKSTVRRQNYTLDLTSPEVSVNVKKAGKDSLYLFFTADENVSFYYTLDGSNPLYSKKTQIAGNKFLTSNARVVTQRKENTKLVMYAEDISGNQSSMIIMDVLKPRAIPSIPSGTERVYDRMLSVALHTFDQARIYYARSNNTPTKDSTLYTRPIEITKTDTIVAFVIDAAGFAGELDTFIYKIDLPPTADFSLSADTILIFDTLQINASRSSDRETPRGALKWSWTIITGTHRRVLASEKMLVQKVFTHPGTYFIDLMVEDAAGRTAHMKKRVIVTKPCGESMVFIASDSIGGFCIDTYEFPNSKGARVETGVSWVQAKMHCIDLGKSLCTKYQWETACNAVSKGHYPYGHTYNPTRCATQGDELFSAGSFDHCSDPAGPQDMVGNAWEWVDSKQDDYPLMKGGSFLYGPNAHCKQGAIANYATEQKDIGFRCCQE